MMRYVATDMGAMSYEKIEDIRSFNVGSRTQQKQENGCAYVHRGYCTLDNCKLSCGSLTPSCRDHNSFCCCN